MKRLSSAKAKKALEFLAKKCLGASKVEIALTPYFDEDFKKKKTNDILYSVNITVSYKDGKGYSTPLVMELHNDYGHSISYVVQFGISYAKLLRWIEKKASIRNAIFRVHDHLIFDSRDSIDSILVELDLEEYEEQKDN